MTQQYESPPPIFGEWYIEVDYSGNPFEGSRIFQAIGWDERFGGCGVIGELFDGDCTGIYDIIDMPWKHIPEEELDHVACSTLR